MYLGIDVGGTHTDGVCLSDDFQILRAAKTSTSAGRPLESLGTILAKILTGADPAKVRRLVLSSTIGLNAVLTGRADPVGVLATGGPGLSPALWHSGPLFALLGASLDHRGEILSPFSAEEAASESKRLLADGAKAWAVISKFGPKNPGFEMKMAEAAHKIAPDLPLTRASELAGRLNFPRRLHTAVLNSAVTRLYDTFLGDLEEAARGLGLGCPISLLSAEGGAMTLAEARQAPVKILAAGPAAGILGLWGLADLSGDALMIDIGGTSTDLAIMADGRPLMTAEGLDIGGQPTLVRAFLSKSIALGGDSALTFSSGKCEVGPEREGPALALCPQEAPGRRPTLTDALNVLGLAEVGDRELSLNALERVGGQPPETLAQAALDRALTMVQSAAAELTHYVNNRPVYTIDEVRLARKVRPERAALLGGPAEALSAPLARRFQMPVTVPQEAGVANAVGAALARPAISAELYADTALGRLNIPTLNINKTIDRAYNLQKAEAELLALLAEQHPAESPVITQSQSFHQLASYGRSDKIIRVQAQIAPGVLTRRTQYEPTQIVSAETATA